MVNTNQELAPESAEQTAQRKLTRPSFSFSTYIIYYYNDSLVVAINGCGQVGVTSAPDIFFCSSEDGNYVATLRTRRLSANLKFHLRKVVTWPPYFLRLECSSLALATLYLSFNSAHKMKVKGRQRQTK